MFIFLVFVLDDIVDVDRVYIDILSSMGLDHPAGMLIVASTLAMVKYQV